MKFFRRNFFRRNAVPADVLSSADLEPGENVLGWAEVAGDHRGHALTTDRAIVLVGGVQQRIPYVRVIRAAWNTPALELVVQDTSGGPTRMVRLMMQDPGKVPLVVRDRVTASVVSQQHVPLREDGKGARMVSRRDPVTKEIRWAVVFDTGLDPSDPALRAAADAALAELKGQLGL